MLRAQPPTHRPAWMVVLAATMLLYGGLTLVGGLLTVRDPKAFTRHAIPNIARTPAMDEKVRKLAPILDAVADRHRVGMRIVAVASIAFGVFSLYAVAAVLSRDRNGRRLALLTALFGIAYQLGDVPLSLAMAREQLAVAGPLMADIMAASGEGAGRTQAELKAMLDATAVKSALAAVVGVGWCLLLLVYFGGRRGRELYGLQRP